MIQSMTLLELKKNKSSAARLIKDAHRVSTIHRALFTIQQEKINRKAWRKIIMTSSMRKNQLQEVKIKKSTLKMRVPIDQMLMSNFANSS